LRLHAAICARPVASNACLDLACST
jgi:hypothetical protein